MSTLRNNFSLILIIIIIGVGLLSVVSYISSSITENEIKQIATQDIRHNARIQTYDLSRILVHSLDAITSNLRMLTISPELINDTEKIQQLLIKAQASTSHITHGYYWIDDNGKIITSSKRDLENSKNTINVKQQPFFLNPKQTLSPFYSTAIHSYSNSFPFLYVSFPLINKQFINDNIISNKSQIFEGIMMAAISVESLGSFLQNELTSSILGNVGLIDRNGVIIYARNQSIIGKNYLSEDFQSAIPIELKEPYNAILKNSLQGKSAAEDITYRGFTTTLSYEPIIINGKYLWTLYISFPHQFASSVGSLIEQQNIFSTIIIVITGSVTLVIVYLILSWNRRLEREVNTRTSQLKNTNLSLMQSNQLLAKANEKLQVHDKMQKEFINIAAHELRTPIMPILGEVELIKDDIDTIHRTVNVDEEQIKLIIRNAKRLDRLASDILDVTRIESNSLKLQKNNFDLNNILLDSVNDIKNQINVDPVLSKNLEILYEPVSIIVNADKERIIQVISNLLSNALKFTSKGVIQITTKIEKNNVIVIIKDSGTGIHPEIFPRLFQKFVTKSDKGTGLGLYISKNIINSHKGKIWAQNNKEGGATFFFSLPL
ncbi:MAG: ATP-binding protein [Nitrososphaeraceae archaeon]